MVDLLVASGANAKVATRYNITPLSLACTNGNATIIEHLLNAGAEPNSTSEEGETGSHDSFAHREIGCGQAAAHARSRGECEGALHGQTALMWAARKATPPLPRC